jgi:hypothetical protein
MVESQEGGAISSTTPPPNDVYDMGQYTGDKMVIFVGMLRLFVSEPVMLIFLPLQLVWEWLGSVSSLTYALQS